MPPPILYYITDRAHFSGEEADRRRQLLVKINEAARCGVDYIQLREKDLCSHDLETLAREAMGAIRAGFGGVHHDASRLLINSRTDVALAGSADGVHLPSGDLSPAEVRRIWTRARSLTNRDIDADPVVSVSCHSPEEIAQAAAAGADLAVFAPVFEKKDSPATRPAGIEALRQACRYRIPVLALGGVTLENARACLEAGAAGIAAIRLFQENDIGKVVAALRS
jgi:thiamine-phosphate pyrophosphorylase